MARKLPWAVDTIPVPKTYQKERNPCVEPSRDQTLKSPFAKAPKTPQPQLQRKRQESHSPPSSPIRDPSEHTPRIEAMRTGPLSDDRYIMVEDEFEAVAKTFTAHLHAAEYERLRRKAKEAPPKPLPDASPSMTKTSRLSLERKKLQSKQTSTLKGLTESKNSSTAKDPVEDNDDLKQEEEEEEEEEEEASIDDPWSGTSLAGLMEESSNHSSSQMRPSLMGLQRLNPSTRAARGFGRRETESSPRKKRKTILDTADPDDTREESEEEGEEYRMSNHNRGNHNRANRGKITAPPPTSPSPSPSNRTNKASTQSKNRAIVDGDDDDEAGTRLNKIDQNPRSPILPAPSRPHYSKHKKRSRIDDLDDFDESQFPPSSRIKSEHCPPPLSLLATSSHPTTRRWKRDDVKEKQKDRKSRLDEVPGFVV